MKRALIIVLCILIPALICGCNGEEQETMATTGSEMTVTVINGVQEADVWILPDTEAYRKTTVWGAATAAKVAAGESRLTPLCEPGDDGHYLLRMIDADSFYYSAGGITLRDGWTLRIQETDVMAVTLEVADESGVTRDTYDVFCGRL